MDPLLEERIAARHRLVIAPIVGGLEPPGERGDVREHHLADRARGQLCPEADGERLVVIVLANEHDTSGTVACVDHRAVVHQKGEGRLLDEHVLSGSECLQRQLQVKPRRHGHNDRLDSRIVVSRPRSPA